MRLFKRKPRSDEVKKSFCSAVVPAAGSSSRMEGINKMFVELDGVPVLARTLLALDACDTINEIVIVTRDVDIPDTVKLCKEYQVTKVTQIVRGGDTRTESVSKGLKAVSPEADLVAVHDGARPFITPEVVDEAVKVAEIYHAAAPGVEVKDTIKIVKDGRVVDTPDRNSMFGIQTPQVFDVDLLRGALANAMEKGLVITDDCMAVEAIGGEVRIVPGSYDNIKITTPEDLYTGKAILLAREEKL